MKTHKREILIYYNPESSSDRKTVAHAQGLVTHVRTFSYAQAPSNGTSWQQILWALNMDPKLLLNKAHPYYQSNIRGRDFDHESWGKVLQRNPDIIKAPIAIRGKRAIQCLTATDIYKLYMVEA
ncbi:MAG: glutaredoxin [Bacteroidetes bacterium]|nr:glutaredoxin [Bacteroidota bacterium]